MDQGAERRRAVVEAQWAHMKSGLVWEARSSLRHCLGGLETCLGGLLSPPKEAWLGGLLSHPKEAWLGGTEAWLGGT